MNYVSDTRIGAMASQEVHPQKLAWTARGRPVYILALPDLPALIH